MKETISTNNKFRILIDAVNRIYSRISFWTKASDVEFDDGGTAETKLGDILGITDSLTSDSSNVAASAYAVKELNDKVTELTKSVNSSLIKYIGTYYASSNSTITVNCTGIKNYSKFSANNFIVGITDIGGAGSDTIYGSETYWAVCAFTGSGILKSYSNGILSIRTPISLGWTVNPHDGSPYSESRYPTLTYVVYVDYSGIS
jgi:hypothetical protein